MKLCQQDSETRFTPDSEDATVCAVHHLYLVKCCSALQSGDVASLKACSPSYL